MDFIYHPVFKEHDTGGHPENASRLQFLDDLLPSDIPYDESVLSLIHKDDYIGKVRQYSRSAIPLDGDTVTSKRSFEAAVYAANATILASAQNDFAMVRPPGHHAYPDRASGFCLFNNVAIASQLLANQGKKVLILDFDGHLGDGTSRIFYESDDVLYWTLHQTPAFPGHGTPGEIGEGPGRGFTINVALPPGSGDDIYLNALQHTLPVVKQFNPDVVAVSAGFDSHQYDMLLDLRFSAEVFHTTGRILSENFSTIFATLEGGYNTDVLPACVYNFMDGINGNEIRYPESRTESDIKIWMEYEMRLDMLLAKLYPYWKF